MGGGYPNGGYRSAAAQSSGSQREGGSQPSSSGGYLGDAAKFFAPSAGAASAAEREAIAARAAQFARFSRVLPWVGAAILAWEFYDLFVRRQVLPNMRNPIAGDWESTCTGFNYGPLHNGNAVACGTTQALSQAQLDRQLAQLGVRQAIPANQLGPGLPPVFIASGLQWFWMNKKPLNVLASTTHVKLWAGLSGANGMPWPVEWPYRYMPSWLPAQFPPMVPTPDPEPVPYTIAPLMPNSDMPEGSERGYTPQRQAEPSPQVRTATDFHEWAPPDRKTRERKFKAALPPGAIRALVNVATESADFISSLFSALPYKLRGQAIHEYGKQWADGSWHISIQGKLQALFDHYQDINIEKAMVNYAKRLANDFIIGTLGKGSAKAAQALDRAIPGSGSGQTPMTVQGHDPNGQDAYGQQRPGSGPTVMANPGGDLFDAIYGLLK